MSSYTKYFYHATIISYTVPRNDIIEPLGEYVKLGQPVNLTCPLKPSESPDIRKWFFSYNSNLNDLKPLHVDLITIERMNLVHSGFYYCVLQRNESIIIGKKSLIPQVKYSR